MRAVVSVEKYMNHDRSTDLSESLKAFVQLRRSIEIDEHIC